ncbi:MAG: hypothetical protein RL654_310 [Pseudomonadota bacterium]
MNAPARPVFDAEQARLAAAAHLPPELFVEFQRLAKTLIHGPAFQLLMVDCRDERLRARVLASLGELQQRAGLRGAEVALHEPVAGDVSALESRLIEAARDHEVIHLLGASVWMDDAAWQSFNLVRERLAVQVRARLVFWLNEEAIARIARQAADLWAWRGGVYRFAAEENPLDVMDLQRHATASAACVQSAFDARSMKERYQRVAEIRSMLGRATTLPDDLRAPLLEELACLLASLGSSQAVIDLVEADLLPLADRMADLRLMAEAWTCWADAKQALGDLDAALQTYREKVIPIQVRRADERAVAVIHGRIADVLQERGDLHEALKIRQYEELPVHEKLGDMRFRAVTMGRIADILQARGDLAQALKIRREEELPVYEKLGAVRERAVTMGKIAGILQSQGDLEEALKIRRDEELPVYEKLGLELDLLVGRNNLAMVLHQRGFLKDRPEIHVLLKRAYAAAKRLGLPEARRIAQRYQQIFRKPIDAAKT